MREESVSQIKIAGTWDCLGPECTVVAASFISDVALKIVFGLLFCYKTLRMLCTLWESVVQFACQWNLCNLRLTESVAEFLCGKAVWILSSLCDAVCVWAESVWNVWQSVWQCQFKRSRVCCRVSAATKATKVLSHQLLADSLAECVWQNPESLETCLWDCGKVHVES